MMRSRLRRALLVAAAYVLLTASPAAGQAWRITEFEVLAVEPIQGRATVARADPLPGRNGAEAAAADLIDVLTLLSRRSPFDLEAAGVRTVDLDPDVKHQFEAHLTNTARLYERWGFPEPTLEPVVTTADGRRAYRVYVVTDPIWLTVRNLPGLASGVFHRQSCVMEGLTGPQESIIVFNGSAIGLASAAARREDLVTLSHELFHAVQASMPFFQAPCGHGPSGWITEGTAEAAAWDAVERIGLVDLSGVDGLTRWGARSYRNVRLPVPGPEDLPGSPRLPYQTSSFWRYLAEYHASARTGGGPPTPSPGPVDYSYLVDFFRRSPVESCQGPSDECDAEVRLLDGWLKSRYGGRGLRDFFLRFVANAARYEDQRPGAQMWSWTVSTLGCVSLPTLTRGLGAGDALTVEFKTGGAVELTADCYTVRLDGFNGATVPVEVIVSGPSEAVLEQFAAAVSLRDGPVADTRIAVEQLAGNRVQARWVFQVPSSGGPTPVLLANVARRAEDTVPVGGVISVRFTALAELATMGTGDRGRLSASDIDAPIPLDLELDQLEGGVAHDASVAGVPNACTLLITMLGGGSAGTGAQMALTHAGPIGPGVYDIYPGDVSASRGPQDHAGTFEVGAFLSADHPLSVEGRRQVFGAQAGTVELDSVSGGVVRGRVRAAGERCWLCHELGRFGISEQRWGLPSLTWKAEFAVLVSDPKFRLQHPGTLGRYGSDCLTSETTGRPVAPRPRPTPRPPAPPTPETTPPPVSRPPVTPPAGPPAAPPPATPPPVTPPAAPPVPPPARGSSTGRAVGTVTLDFLETATRSDLRGSPLAVRPAEVSPGSRSVTATRFPLRLRLPAATFASCAIPASAPAWAQELRRERFVTGALELVVGDDGSFSLDQVLADGRLRVRAAAGGATAAARTSGPRGPETRYDVKNATLELQWSGGGATCGVPVGFSFVLMDAK